MTTLYNVHSSLFRIERSLDENNVATVSHRVSFDSADSAFGSLPRPKTRVRGSENVTDGYRSAIPSIGSDSFLSVRNRTSQDGWIRKDAVALGRVIDDRNLANDFVFRSRMDREA